MKLGAATARQLCCPMSTKMFSNFQPDDEDQDDKKTDDFRSSMIISLIVRQLFHVILPRSCSVFQYLLSLNGKFDLE